MYFKKTLSIVLVSLGSIVMTAAFFSNTYFKQNSIEKNKREVMQDFKKEWKRIDSLLDAGLPESAAPLIDNIYTKTKATKDVPQYLRSVMYRLRLIEMKEEEAAEKSIQLLNKEIKVAPFPAKPLLQSLLADVSWQYFQANRWKFHERSTTSDFEPENIATWNLKQLLDFCIKNYKSSLSNTDSLMQTKIDVYDYILKKGGAETRKLRPTLYDFLAHRALQFFRSAESDINRPAATFDLNQPQLLANTNDFLATKLNAQNDSLHLKYYAFQLFQQLAKMHLNTNNPDALIDVELERLNTAWALSGHQYKDSLYLQSLTQLSQLFPKNPESGRAMYEMAQWYSNKGAEYRPLQDEQYKWYRKKAMTILSDVIKKYPASYASSLSKNLANQIKAKGFSMNIEHVNEPGKASRALVTYRNNSRMYFRLVKSTFQNDKEWRKTLWGESLVKKYLQLKTEKQFEYILPDDGDMNEHRVEVKIPELAHGFYILLASSTPQFDFSKNTVSHIPFWVSNLAFTSRRMEDGTYDVYVMNRQTGQGLKGVKVQSWIDKYDYKSRNYLTEKGSSFSTDDKGYVNIRQEELERNANFFLDFSLENDYLHSESAFYTYKPYETEREMARTFFFTDRSIYRPGQTVHFKAIRILSKGKENQLQKNTQLVIALHDVNYTKVSEIKLQTNEYGSVAGSFVLPMGLLNGQMTITDGQSSTTIAVEEYKRPKFEIMFNPSTEAYTVGDLVNIKGTVKAFAGYGISSASVKYRVVRKMRYPYWCYWYKPYITSRADVEIQNGVVMSNDTGGFQINFTALADEMVSDKDEPVYTYAVMLDATDINGETHSAETSLSLSYKAMQLTIEAEEQMDVAAMKKIKIIPANFNGFPVKAKGNLTVYQLKQPEKIYRQRLWPQPDKYLMKEEEYAKLFPNDLYEDETNKYKWKKQDMVVNFSFDTDLSSEIDLARMLKAGTTPGTYLIEAVIKDKKGMEVKGLKYITLYDRAVNAATPERVFDWFKTIKNEAEPGEEITFVQSSAVELNYLLEVEHDRKIVSKEFKKASMNEVVIPVKEAYRGNFVYHISFIQQNRFYSRSIMATVPFTNKELEVAFESFRDKLLPGQQEEWKLILKNKKGEKEIAELLTTMYDASLDAFKENSWFLDVFSKYYSSLYWSSNVGNINSSYTCGISPQDKVVLKERIYDLLNTFGWQLAATGGGGRDIMMYSNMVKGEAADEAQAPAQTAMPGKTSEVKSKTGLEGSLAGGNTGANERKDAEPVIKARSNFNETAFFFPQLQTNEKGEVVIKFTVPESITKWKLMGLAHTNDLRIAKFTKELVTRKNLMVQSNTPRFLRENDKITLSPKLINLTEETASGTAELHLLDAITRKPLDIEFGNKIPAQTFSLTKGQSAAVSWDILVPSGIDAVICRVIAKAGNNSDGEEILIPVLKNSLLVTESLPFYIKGKQEKEVKFERFLAQNNNSSTLRNHSYTIEFTANPAWYALQSLPYIMEYPYQCSEQVFSRFYANSIASYIVNSSPSIKQVFESWKQQSPDAFLSQLEKNQELKNILLEETPWVMEAKTEKERKNRIALLFDLNKMASEKEEALNRLMKMQLPNGAWAWFDGGPDDWYITQHILTGLGHMVKMGILKENENTETSKMIGRALKYCDERVADTYEKLTKNNKDPEKGNNLEANIVQYLYLNSFFAAQTKSAATKRAIAYYTRQAEINWLSQGKYLQAMIALAMYRASNTKTANAILKSLKECALSNEEMGMYWKENYAGYTWSEAPIECQALMIEAFDEISGNQQVVDELKIWLIKSKQTQNWQTTKATCEAVYALLLKGTNWLSTEQNTEIKIGPEKLNLLSDPLLKAEAGTGYYKKTYSAPEVSTKLGKVKVSKKDEGISWGALYWQYFEVPEKVTSSSNKTTALQLNRKLFVEKMTSSGPVMEPLSDNMKIKPGDKIKVRIELKADRDMQYVHLKDMRASGFEPVNVLSSYKWQDGLGYYESTKDLCTNFYFSWLGKGKYVFEYLLLASHAGNFSNGICSIQCMYAPELGNHSSGSRVEIQK